MNRKRKKTSPVEKAARTVTVPGYDSVLSDVVELLAAARRASARTVNAIMTATYWEMGRRIVEYEQSGQERADYGEALLKRLSCDLMKRFGRGFSERNLRKCRAFYLGWPIWPTVSAKSQDEKCPTVSGKSSAEIWPTASAESGGEVLSTASDESPTAIVQNLRAFSYLRSIAARFPLPWSHYVRLLSVANSLAREFYETEALRGGWTMRQLDRQIGSQFYERTALSRRKTAMLSKGGKPRPEDAMSPDEEIRDPLVLEFLGLKDEYSETDLEDALIQHLESFLLELGNDFAFVGRQKRLRIDHEWFLCTEQGESLARYALEGLPNKMLIREYQTALPSETLLAAEIRKARKRLESRITGRQL